MQKDSVKQTPPKMSNLIQLTCECNVSDLSARIVRFSPLSMAWKYV